MIDSIWDESDSHSNTLIGYNVVDCLICHLTTTYFLLFFFRSCNPSVSRKIPNSDILKFRAKTYLSPASIKNNIYYFSLCEKEVSFSNLLTRANHTRPCFFLLIFIKLYWGQSAKRLLGVVRLPFYVVKIQKRWPKIVTFSARNVSDQLLTLNMHLIITIDLL